MSRSSHLDWLLVEFTRATPGVDLAVVVSADGLRLATSPGVSQQLGDQLAAATSGLVSLARGTARLLDDGSLSQTILEMDDGYLFITAIDRAATLAIHAVRGCDIGMVGYEIAMLGARAGHALSPDERNGTPR